MARGRRLVRCLETFDVVDGGPYREGVGARIRAGGNEWGKGEQESDEGVGEEHL